MAETATAKNTKRGNGKRLRIIAIILALAVIGALAIIFYYHYQSSRYIVTENAKVTGEMINVTTTVTGVISEWLVDTGTRVEKSQVLGSEEVTPTSAAGSSTGTTWLLRAPAGGTVIKSDAKVGAPVAPGQVLAVIMDMDSLYVEANIKETAINKVAVGQKVDITFDAAKGKVLKGKVRSIGMATTSVFSLLPDMNSGGNFTKVTRVVPVRISLTETEAVKLLPGMNATVRIHLR